jgi:cytochrome P450
MYSDKRSLLLTLLLAMLPSAEICPSMSDRCHAAAAFLLFCLQDGNLSEQQMADAGIGLIIAGNDTSGLGITALLAILPQFPAVVKKLRQEQREVRSMDCGFF